MRYLFIIFILVPFIEIYMLLQVSDIIGSSWTILAVIATAIIGASLVKQQGLMTLNSVQSKMNSGQLPAMELAEGMAILVAGALLLTPGFVTDMFGFACLIPPLRRLGIRSLIHSGLIKVQSPMQNGTRSRNTQGASSADVIEGEYKDIDQ